MEKRMLRKRHLLIIFMIVVISVYLNTVHSEQKPSSRSITALINKNRMEQTQNVTAYNIVNYSGTIFYKNKVAVLTYHHLDPVESSVTITPERFESQLKVMKKNGFHVISMEDFVAFLQKKKPVPPNAVVITFDDGYESVYKYAYPILKSEGVTATVFLVVGWIEDGTVRHPPIMNWKEIMEMHSEGLSFYSHSYNSHETVLIKGKPTSPFVAKLINPSSNRLETEGEYEARVRVDLSKADNILNSRLGKMVNLLCFPHGQYNQTSVNIAHQLDIPYMFTGKSGLNTNQNTLIKRINAGSPFMSSKRLIYRLSQFKILG